MHALTLSAGLLAEIIRHAESCRPQEGCGLLAGRGSEAERFIPMDNCLASSAAYEIDPGQLIQVLRSLRDTGDQLVAIYHSHPSTTAQPSSRDIDQAGYPDAAHLIVSLADPAQPRARAFRILAGKSDEIELRVIV